VNVTRFHAANADEQETTRLLFERRDRLVRSRTECVNRLRALALRLDMELTSDLTSLKAMGSVERRIASFRPQGYAQSELLDEMRDTVIEVRRILVKVRELEKRLVPFVERLAPEFVRGFFEFAARHSRLRVGTTAAAPDA